MSAGPSLSCQVSDPEQELTVTHMYYTAWPDHGVPRNAMSVISFIHRVRKEHPAYLDLPLLVHCSAGVGRTGTFILLDSVMQQINRGDSECRQLPHEPSRSAHEDGPDKGKLHEHSLMYTIRPIIYSIEGCLCMQAQYVFIHDSQSELVVCGETEIYSGS